MKIRTIEFKDVRKNDFRIRVSEIDETERIQTNTVPNGLWFHFDIDKYTLEEAKQMLIDEYIKLQEDEIKLANEKIQKVLKDNK